MNNLKKTALAAAVATAMGVSASASADTINLSFDGWFTLIDPGGTAFNNSDTGGAPMYGYRTPVSGLMDFNTHTGSGGGSMGGFSFGAAGDAVATTISLQSTGSNLVLANLGFNWSGNNGIPVSLVLDASGFFGAMGGGLATSDIVSGAGATAASEGDLFNFGKFSYTLPMGPIPIATTDWDTTNTVTPLTLGVNPSGTLPYIADPASIGGSPMGAGPFPGWNANFDIVALHIRSVVGDTPPPAIPVPAAVWLFGSGLMGLVGVARRRRKSA